MTTSGPVFIVGQARSGSSILYRLILEHPSFRPDGSGALNLSESHVVDALLTTPDLDTPSVRAYTALAGAGWEALRADLDRSRRRRWVLRHLPERALRHSTALWRAAGGASAIRAFVDHAAAGRGVSRLVEKTPWHLPWVGHLLASVPDARILSICRHPVSVYASYRRRSREDPEGSWAEVSVADFVERWRAEARAVERWLGDDRFRVVGYEELVARPEQVGEELFRWLGEEPPSVSLGEVPVNPFAPVSDATQLSRPIGAVGSRWEQHVSAEDAAAIVDALGEHLERLGRPPL